MSIGNYELANLFAVLSVGRKLEWEDQVDGSGDPDTTGAPNSASDGVSLAGLVTGGTATAGVRAELRRQAWKRSARLVPVGPVIGDTYRFTVNGNNVDFVAASAVVDDIVDGLIAALPGVPAAAALVTFEGRNDDDENTAPFTHLHIATILEASQSFGGSIIGGGGSTMLLKCDAEAATLRLWSCDFTSEGAADGDTWALLNGGAFGPLDYRGMRERLVVGGHARLYGEYHTVSGFAGDAAGAGCTLSYDPHVWIAPAIEEA